MDNFLKYRNGLWLKITCVLTVLLIVSYVVYSRRMTPSGGSVMGLAYGTLGTIFIILLMYFGIRKRSYYAGLGTLQAWLSFHVYIGTLTLLLIPLHAGFKFGLDVHTLAYALLAIVVLSGFVGAYAYLTLPRQYAESGEELVFASDPRIRGKSTHDEEYQKILQQIQTLSEGKSADFHHKCAEEMHHGVPRKHMGWGLVFGRVPAASSAATVQEFQEYLGRASIPEREHKAFETLTVLATRKRDLEGRLLAQMGLKNLLEAWLYVHVPVSLVMCLAVLVHIFVVVYY
jgi:hypothetical protein